MLSQFSKSAQYYDLLYGGKNYDAEAELYESAIQRAHHIWNYGTRDSLIEFGCGTGMFGGAMKRLYGWEVTGIDKSPEMVAIANQRWIAAKVGDLNRRHFYSTAGKMYPANVETTVGYSRWNAGVATFAVLSYAAGQGALSTVLDNIRGSLHDGGRFACDVVNASAAIIALRPLEERVVENDVFRVRRVWRKRFDYVRSMLTYDVEFTVTDKPTGVDEAWREQHCLRAFTPAELVARLILADFRPTQVTNMDGNPVEPDDWSFFVAAEACKRD